MGGLKTVYIQTEKDIIRAFRKRNRLIKRGFTVMWTGEYKICLMKKYPKEVKK